jgi:UDP-glucose 4-epimerase
MRVLITGAAGYIGQQLLNQLAIQHPQWMLIAADIRPQNRAGMKLNIEPVLLDISQPAAVEDCVATWPPGNRKQSSTWPRWSPRRPA